MCPYRALQDTTCYPGLKPVTEDAPALKPVTDDAPALEAVTAGGETLSSIKEFPEEEPAPAASAWQSARRRLPTHSLTPSRVRCV